MHSLLPLCQDRKLRFVRQLLILFHPGKKVYLAISYKYIEHFYEISFKIRPFEAIFLSKVLLTQDPSAVLGCFKLLNPV